MIRSATGKSEFLWLTCLMTAIACSSVWAGPAGTIEGLKIDSDGKRFVIECSGAVGKHRASVMGQPNRLVVDFEEADVGKVPRKIPGGQGGLHEIRVGRYRGHARVVVDFQTRQVPTYQIKPEKDQVVVSFGTAPDSQAAGDAAKPTGPSVAAGPSSASSGVLAVQVKQSEGGDATKGPDVAETGKTSAKDAAASSPDRPVVAAAASVSPKSKPGKKKDAASKAEEAKTEKKAAKDDSSTPASGESAGDWERAATAESLEGGRATASDSKDSKKLSEAKDSKKAAEPKDSKKSSEHKESKAEGQSKESKQEGEPKEVKLAQVLPSPPGGSRPADPPSSPPKTPDAPFPAGGGPSGGARMVREVRPPVTPPTPDPRLVVQEITELKFIQVGHNSRLIVRGGDHLDYRLNKASPTKIRLDLINAEIPKVHQKPLKTDEFSTSVEMIVPGSQTIFVQLKDAVPYQVQKQKGVLMIDFPPPRFALTEDQTSALAPKSGEPVAVRPGDATGAEEYQKKRESLLQRREAARIMREEEYRRRSENIATQIAQLLKEQEEILKERRAIEKKYRVTDDPEIFNKPVTMDFQGISVKNVFRLLAEQAGLNIIVGPEVTGTVTMRLFQVPLGQVVEHIMKNHNLDRDLVGNVMWVGSTSRIAAQKNNRMREYRTLLGQNQGKLDRNKKEIAQLEKDREEALKELAKKEEPETDEIATPDAPQVETVGATETIDVDGEPVTLVLVQVKLNYATVAEITPVLRCVFNRNCGAGLPQPEALDEQVMNEAQARLTAQGFQPGSPGAESRLRSISRELDRTRRTVAAEAMSQQLGVGEAAGALRGGEMDPKMRKILAHTVIWPNATYNMLFIKDIPERIEEMKKLIATLDIPKPLVMVEARIVQATRDWTRGLGITWGATNNQVTSPIARSRRKVWGFTGTAGPDPLNPAASGKPVTSGDIPNTFVVDLPAAAGRLMGLALQFGLIQGQYATDLDVILNLGETTGQSKTIGRPKVQVLDQRAATILSGRQIAYETVSADGVQTQLVNADLSLTVTPRVYPDGRIQLTLVVTDNEPDFTTVPTSIIRRQANTILIIKDGETAVIGGILRKEIDAGRAGWPGLMNVPILNFFFSNNNKSELIAELLIFITPTIMKQAPSAA